MDELTSAVQLSTLNIYIRVAGKAIPKLEQLREQRTGALSELYCTTIQLFRTLHDQASTIRDEALANNRLLYATDCEPLKPLAHQCAVSLTQISQSDQEARDAAFPLCRPPTIWL